MLVLFIKVLYHTKGLLMESMPGIVIDHHVLAGISIAGIVCDVLGGLYLAYH